MSRWIALVLAAVGGAFGYALLAAERRQQEAARRTGDALSAPTPAEAAAPHRCEAKTGNGKRCSRPAEPGSRFCWQHAS